MKYLRRLKVNIWCQDITAPTLHALYRVPLLTENMKCIGTGQDIYLISIQCSIVVASKVKLE